MTIHRVQRFDSGDDLVELTPDLHLDADWNEEDHPRDEAGRFGTGSGLSKGDHSKASGAHVAKMIEHEGKEITARKSGDTAKAEEHRQAAAAHGKAAEEHALAARNVEGSSDRARDLSNAAHNASDRATGSNVRERGPRKGDVPAESGEKHGHANVPGAHTYAGSRDMPKGVTEVNEGALFDVMNGQQIAPAMVHPSSANHVRRAIKGGYGSIQKGANGKPEIHLTELGKDRQVAHSEKQRQHAESKLAMIKDPKLSDRFPGKTTSEKLRGEAHRVGGGGGSTVLAGHLERLAREHASRGDGTDVVRAVARFDGGSEGLSRFDVGELGKAKRLKNGWLKAEAYLTRSGVFHYRLPDGKIQREYRPPSEVFNADSLDTLQLVPVTDEHPPEMLNAVNTVDYSRGAVGERVRKDGSKVAAPLMVQHKDLIAKMDRGSNQVSCGYTCDLDFTAGVTPSGEKYDAIQKNIRYNHVAILERGRAGPDVRVRMDGAGEAVLLDRGIGSGSTTSTERTMHKIKIGGITFDVDDSRLAEAINNEFARRDSEVEQLRKDAASLAESSKKEKAELTAKLDTATDTIAKRDAAIKELPAKLAKEAKARGDLVAKVRAVVGSKKKLDGLSDKELQLLALERLAPSKKFDEADDVTIAAHFTARFDHFEEENPEASRFDAFAKKGKGAESKEEEEEENEEEKKVGKKDRDDDEPRGPAYRGHFDRAEDEESGVTLDADEIRERTRKYNARLHLQPIPGARTRKGAYSEH